jgi:hypothetical protein
MMLHLLGLVSFHPRYLCEETMSLCFFLSSSPLLEFEVGPPGVVGTCLLVILISSSENGVCEYPSILCGSEFASNKNFVWKYMFILKWAGEQITWWNVFGVCIGGVIGICLFSLSCSSSENRVRVWSRIWGSLVS